MLTESCIGVISTVTVLITKTKTVLTTTAGQHIDILSILGGNLQAPNNLMQFRLRGLRCNDQNNYRDTLMQKI